MNIKTFITSLGKLLPLWVILLAGCSSQVEVKGNFPTPVVNQMPFTLGIHYPQRFSSYTYIEYNKDRDDRSIGIGSAQVSLFSTVLPSMFKKVVPVTDINNIAPVEPVDLVLTVDVDEFQYTVPSETRVDMYEVWIKYNLRLFDPQGQLIADWLLTAYGKTPNEMLQSESEAINQAMIVALRDAGASFSLSFNQVPEIRQWLENQSSRQI